MGGRVVFSLTEDQAAALVAIRAGRAPKFANDRHGTRAWTVLYDRGLVRSNGHGIELTPLGQAAAAVADKLAKR